MSDPRYTVEAEALADVAARCASPDNLEAGRRQVEAVVAQLLVRLKRVDIARAVSVVIVVLFAIIVGILMHDPPHRNAWVIPVGILLTIGLATFVIFGGRWIQRPRGFLNGGRRYAIAIPPGLEHLLDELSENRLRAALTVVDGTFAASAFQSSDGRAFDFLFAPRVFRNRYAPILFSARPQETIYLHISGGPNLNRPLCIVRDVTVATSSSSPVDDEPPNQNESERDRWLVSGSREHFARGLDAFIAQEGIPPHQVDWYRLVLTVGRRKLREGAQRGVQAEAIAAVQSELRTHLGKDVGPQGGDPSHLIKQLLTGKRGQSDIKRYFDASAPREIGEASDIVR